MLGADELVYPYFAKETRETRIRSRFREISSGMSTEQVKMILGDPDQIKNLFEPKVKSPRRIGQTYWYLIQRLSDSGSVEEKDEKLVRVSFDLNGVVTGVDHWGFEPGVDRTVNE